MRTVEFSTDSTALATTQAKPNFKQLGPKLGPLMKQAAGLIAGLKDEQIAQIMGGDSIEVSLRGNSLN